MARHFTIPGVSDVYVGKEGEKRLIMDPYVRLNLPVCLTKWLPFCLYCAPQLVEYNTAYTYRPYMLLFGIIIN